MYKNYLFDVDGTLLPMDMQEFTKLYFGSMTKKMSPIVKVEPQTLINAIWKGTAAMTKNDGSMLNCEAFWRVASADCGVDLKSFEEQFDEYYRNEFIAAKQGTSVSPAAKKSVEYIKRNGGKLIAATNPIFPEVATRNRITWAGLDPDDFEYITVYENSTYCKPNTLYYREICDKCGIIPEESIMVGNDVDEDLCAAKLGFDTYLVKDCIINRENKDFSAHKNGSFDDFYEFLTKE